jgi:hypothetical protein
LSSEKNHDAFLSIGFEVSQVADSASMHKERNAAKTSILENTEQKTHVIKGRYQNFRVSFLVCTTTIASNLWLGVGTLANSFSSFPRAHGAPNLQRRLREDPFDGVPESSLCVGEDSSRSF